MKKRDDDNGKEEEKAEVSFSIPETLKRQFKAHCAEVGLPMSLVLEQVVRRIVDERK